jgi:DNA repair protein RadB
MAEKRISTISTGSRLLDNLLDGGYEIDVITTLFGPAGSGKTNLCLLCMINTIRSGKKVIYIDSEGGFSLTRLEQIAPDFVKILDSIIFLKPTTFEEQKNSFEKLKDLIDERIGLIIVDTISMLYRIERGNEEDTITLANSELSHQISYLSEIARKKSIPVLLTSQVYSDFDNRDKVNIVGGDILRYGSKCLIELQKAHKNKRVAILKKHRSLPEGKEVFFEIVQEGIKELKV